MPRTKEEINEQIQRIKKMRKESRHKGDEKGESYWRGREEMLRWWVEGQRSLKNFI